MSRRYASIWAELKAKKRVVIRCRAVKVRTLVQAVKKEKARDNAPRVSLDLPSFGKMEKVVKFIANGMAEITFFLTVVARAEDL